MRIVYSALHFQQASAHSSAYYVTTLLMSALQLTFRYFSPQHHSHSKINTLRYCSDATTLSNSSYRLQCLTPSVTLLHAFHIRTSKATVAEPFLTHCFLKAATLLGLAHDTLWWPSSHKYTSSTMPGSEGAFPSCIMKRTVRKTVGSR
jgi:hypothetical protein